MASPAAQGADIDGKGRDKVVTEASDKVVVL